jgi:choice-of-anchor C domain-containing protein
MKEGEMKKTLVLLVGTFLLLGLSINVKADPFQNGSFENGPTINNGFVTLYAGSTEIQGWTVDSGSIDLIGDYWTASDGSRSIDLNGAGLGAISQTFDTTTGAWYQVEFEMAGNPDDPGLKVLAVSANTTEEEFEFDSTGTNPSDMQWIEQYFVFQAASDITTLQFRAVSPDSIYGPALDNVRVTLIPRPFPADVRHPTGAVHAHDNILWPPNNKWRRVVFTGYVVDELSMARDGEGIGVARAFLKIDGKKWIILRNKNIDRLDKNGRFRIVRWLQAKKGKVYKVRLYAADTVSIENGGANAGWVDSTYVRVPKNMGGKAKPKKK